LGNISDKTLITILNIFYLHVFCYEFVVSATIFVLKTMFGSSTPISYVKGLGGGIMF
jgi:hypothetical protein